VARVAAAPSIQQDLQTHAASSTNSSKLTPGIESLLFCPYASINPSLATKNRKTGEFCLESCTTAFKNV
jgi:hypothetical protein